MEWKRKENCVLGNQENGVKFGGNWPWMYLTLDRAGAILIFGFLAARQAGRATGRQPVS